MQDYIYTAIQKLTEFGDFVSTIDLFNKSDESKIELFKQNIRNINNLGYEDSFGLSLNIFDRNFTPNKLTKESVYWRYWRVIFESGYLEIECRSRILEDDVFGECSTHKNILIELQLPSIDNSIVSNLELIHAFLADTKEYKSYITAQLNEVEIDYWD
jgi:hypothetical protein